MGFMGFKKAVDARAKELLSEQTLYATVATKEELWQKYCEEFDKVEPEIFLVNKGFECNSCKNFITHLGGVVKIVEENGILKTVSVWPKEISGDEKHTQISKAMANFVEKKAIRTEFYYSEGAVGANEHHREMEDGSVVTFQHFYAKLPSRFVKESVGAETGEIDSSHSVYLRGLNEITPDSLEIVLDLVYQNSLYRGEQYKAMLETFQKLQKQYLDLKGSRQKELFSWYTLRPNSFAACIKNTAIGTLLMDLSEGRDVNDAVNAFEDKVSAGSYKRPTAVYTEKMKKAAEDKVKELGLLSALSRRRAFLSDISASNILYMDAGTEEKKLESASPFDLIENSSKKSNGVPKTFDSVKEIPVQKFISDVLPTAKGLEVFVENRHLKNLVSLIAPADKDAGKLFSWDNNFSWAYSGGAADSLIKQRVKAAGGVVDAPICFRLSWGNTDDLDIHMRETIKGRTFEIYYHDKKSRLSCGQLDVDMNAGGYNLTRNPVENIFYVDKSKMPSGHYHVFVNNYCKRENVDFGFTVEMQVDGVITEFHYDKPLRTGENVSVIEFDWDNARQEMKVTKSLNGTDVQKSEWGIETNSFVPVSLFCYSPNYWGENASGNRHYFFFLKDCKSENPVRGLFNEFLRPDLNQHRRVFEALGSRMLVQPEDGELSGLGFSSTLDNNILVRVLGKVNRVVRVKIG